jgi:hypothetical protein
MRLSGGIRFFYALAEQYSQPYDTQGSSMLSVQLSLRTEMGATPFDGYLWNSVEQTLGPHIHCCSADP